MILATIHEQRNPATTAINKEIISKFCKYKIPNTPTARAIAEGNLDKILLKNSFAKSSLRFHKFFQTLLKMLLCKIWPQRI